MKPSEVTPQHIAAAMRMHVSELMEPTRQFESWFKPAEMRPAGKKHRQCDIPYPLEKRRLRLLHRFAQKHLPAHRCVHGGVRERSCYTAAERHCGRYAVITRDVEDCYPSIGREAFFNELIALGFRGDAAILLTNLMTVRDRIPQGSPASGDALNLFLYRTDELIEHQSARIGGRYTRSADDMVISVRRSEAVNRAAAILEDSIASRGLTINVKKVQRNGLQLRHARQLVHNIAVNSRKGTSVSELRDKNARDCAEGFVRGAKAATPSSLKGLAARRERLLGHYHDTRQARFGPARHLGTQLRIGDQIILRKLQKAGISCFRDRWWLSTEVDRIAESWGEVLHRRKVA